jgi:hypothetical protein
VVEFLQGLRYVFPKTRIDNGAVAAVAATTLPLLQGTNKQIDGAVTVVVIVVVV